jgi:hypothetical protein
MSITRSLNKHNGIYYAYETTYEWNEEKQIPMPRGATSRETHFACYKQPNGR